MKIKKTENDQTGKERSAGAWSQLDFNHNKNSNALLCLEPYEALDRSPVNPWAPYWGLLLCTIYVECTVIFSHSGWESDLWLGLKCPFNEQLLCPCRVSFTNEWVTVSLSLCLCLFIISQIHSISLSASKTEPFSRLGQGSSQDHLSCLAGTSLRSYSIASRCALTLNQSVCHTRYMQTMWKRSNEIQAASISKIKFLKNTAGSLHC